MVNVLYGMVLKNKEKIIPVLIACALIALSVYAKVEMAKIPKPSLGALTVVKESVDLSDLGIQKIVHDDQFMYVLSYTSTGYVQMYDWNGEYQQTLVFYGPSKNGGFDIASVNDVVYVMDNVYNIYVLTGGKLEQFVEKKTAPEQWHAICDMVDFQTASEKFVVRQGDIWRIEKDNEQCVVDRPLTAFIFQYGLGWAIMVIAMLIVAFSIHKSNKHKTEGGFRP